MYVQKLLHDRLGFTLSEELGTLKRYVAMDEDRQRGLLFHPVLLEKLAKSPQYTLQEYVDELRTTLGVVNDVDAWRSVSELNLKKSDKKFKVYLGLCAREEDKNLEKYPQLFQESHEQNQYHITFKWLHSESGVLCD